MDKETFLKTIDQIKRSRSVLMDEMGKAIVGQTEVIRQMLASIFARGHCLLVGVPGLAKTQMVKSLSRLMALTFKRIQFTPDLMPSDITGTNIIEEDDAGHREFKFVQGPLFAHIILADEINRAPPKTQAALLEGMQERQVTVGKTTYDLPRPFFVIATQNPIEQEGTYPLPEAQLDRFMFNIQVNYPSMSEEEQILTATTGGESAELRPVLTGRDLLAIQGAVEKVAVSQYLVGYVARLVRATRPKEPDAPEFVKKMVEWGAGPRAGQYLLLGAKAMAAMDGRVNAAVSDVRAGAVPVLRHRVATNFQAQAEGIDSVEIVKKLLATVEEPKVPMYEK
ncbi:MAG: MoxR family ATPase [Planctomycetes bacterium]|nr:MoxR family ATPase [Planctomycetota bacterium]